MDGKNQIILGEDTEEQVHISLSFGTACTIFVVLLKGLEVVRKDSLDANQVLHNLKKDPLINRDHIMAMSEQIKLMTLCLEDGTNLKKELSAIIQELDGQPKSKIIIPKPKFT